MAKRKFIGKIRTDPWESLAKGPREVMASIWQEYLRDLIDAPPKSGRVRELKRDIEAAAGYPQIYRDWNDLTPEARAEAWRGLVTTARGRLADLAATCLRCGECCELSSPTLLTADLPLFHQEILTWNEVYALPAGDLAASREGKPMALPEERLKVREVAGSRQCVFYVAATRSCRIYETRPEQCRRQQCWEPPAEPKSGDFLSRRHLFEQVPEVWELIKAHLERCSRDQVRQALAELAEGREEAGDELFQALHFDHYLREMLIKEWELTPTAAELLLGRPLKDFLKSLGYQATMTADGVFRLAVRECSQ